VALSPLQPRAADVGYRVMASGGGGLPRASNGDIVTGSESLIQFRNRRYRTRVRVTHGGRASIEAHRKARERLHGASTGHNGGTMQNDSDKLREAWLGLAYAILSAIGVVRLARRLGFSLKPWAAEREHRRDN